MEQSFSDVWSSMGDAEYSCFSSFCTEELVREIFFSTGLSFVANLVWTQCTYVWRHWETCRSFEVFASEYFIWVISYLGVSTLYYSMKHGCVLGLGYECRYGCGTRQFLKKVMQVWWDSAIKKLFKIFLFIFLIYC